MPSLRKEREATVEDLTREFDGIEGLVVAGYVGVKTPELNELRVKLRPVNGKCRIVKNTLAQIALKNKGMAGMDDFFNGQSALVIQKGDAITGFKILVDFEKAHENYKIRGAYMKGKVLKAAEIKAMASLPSRNVLIAQFLGNLQGPLSRFQGVLSAPLRYFAVALDQVAKKKEAAGK